MSDSVYGTRWFGDATLSLATAEVVMLLVLSGCQSRLPKYAEPRGEAVDPASLDGKDLIAYRALSRSDFRAKTPPEEMRPYAERMGAVTCANVLTHPEPEYYVEQKEAEYEGAYLRLEFAARMDRGCSWWNPEGGPVPEDYVLQHEQVHFALAERMARKLNLEAKQVIEHPVRRSTEQAVHQALHDLVEKMMDDAINELVRQNRKFDQMTSNTYAPEEQQRWFDDVLGDLEGSGKAEP